MHIVYFYFVDELRHSLGPAEAAAWLRDTWKRDQEDGAITHPARATGLPKAQSVAGLAELAPHDPPPLNFAWSSERVMRMRRSNSDDSLVSLPAAQTNRKRPDQTTQEAP